MNRLNFYELLFNAGEGICWTTTPKGTGVTAWDGEYMPKDNFFCINPLLVGKDLMPTQN